MSAPSLRPPRVLFFSPYARWLYHTAMEATWAHALRVRGADVRFVLCNGLSKACDIYRANLNPRDELSCLECQAKTAERFADYATEYEWLGNYMPRKARERAEAWAADLPRSELLTARWNDMPVGEWAAASCYTQYRAAELDLGDPDVERTVRDFLVGTVVMAEATEVLFEDYAPDTVVLLNGRFFPHWAAIEIAKHKGIRFVTHERGLRKNTVRFAVDARMHDLSTNRVVWDRWKDVALNRAELKQATEILEERRLGKNYSRLSFSPAAQEAAEVRSRLQLDERPLVAVFNSSDDETAAFPERRAGAFPCSNDFLPAVVEIARSMPEVQFVLRMHPNIHKAEVGPNADALRHAREVTEAAPENVRVIQPRDEISSYTLMDLADVGIVYASTVGLEMAALGKPVLCMAQATYSHTGCVRQVNEAEDLAPALAEALEAGPTHEAARLALRWTLRYFTEFSIPMSQVSEEPNYEASLTFGGLEALLPGNDAILDATCELFAGTIDELLDGPTSEELARTNRDEDVFLNQWLRTVAQRGTGPAPRVA